MDETEDAKAGTRRSPEDDAMDSIFRAFRNDIHDEQNGRRSLHPESLDLLMRQCFRSGAAIVDGLTGTGQCVGDFTPLDDPKPFKIHAVVVRGLDQLINDFESFREASEERWARDADLRQRTVASLERLGS